MIKQLRVASMFAGIGGIDLGFQQAGFSIVWANEKDSDACKTYRKNFKDINLVEEDITKIDVNNIPDFDILTAGFPCQSFSIAGKQRGFEDKRGILFYEIERIVSIKRPKVIFLENVKNLEDHDDGKTFNKIFASLAQFGYCVRYRVMNATKYANIPQNRERIFIIAFLDEQLGEMFEFPNEIPLTKTIMDYIDISDKKHNFYYIPESHPEYNILINSIKDKKQMYQLHFGKIRKGKNGICRTLTASIGSMNLHRPIIKDNYGIRYLMPSECLSLQGFPDSFSFDKDIKIESAYNQVGNSVCVPLIKRLAEKIKNLF